MQWVFRATGQAGDRAAHPIHSGAVDRLVVNGRRLTETARSFEDETAPFTAPSAGFTE